MTVGSTRYLAAGLVAAAAGLYLFGPAAPQAHAQFGSIFGEPPRPPGGVPDSRQGNPFPQPQDAPPPRQQRNFPERIAPGPPPSARRAPVQSEPLPAPDDIMQPERLPDDQPSGARPQRGTAQPADTTPQPGDEVVSTPPTQKIPNGRAVFSGLDKITGRIISFDVELNETVQFGALQVVPRVCYTRPPTEAAATDGFVEVSEVTLQGEIRRIFSGWMFAASPGLNAVEHAIYDVWLTDCKQPLVKVAEDPAPPPPPAAARAQQQTEERPTPRPRPRSAQQPAPRQQPAQQRAFPTPIR